MNIRRLEENRRTYVGLEKRQIGQAEVEAVHVLVFFVWPRYSALPSDDTVIVWILFTKFIK